MWAKSTHRLRFRGSDVSSVAISYLAARLLSKWRDLLKTRIS
jgi:hypothetical protein